MYDAKQIKDAQLPLQRKALEEAIAVAETSANPVIEVGFVLYPEVMNELKERGWVAGEPYRIVYEGNVKYITHIYPEGVQHVKEESEKSA